MEFPCRIKQLFCGFLIWACAAGPGQAGDLTVFAAASLKEALDTIAQNFSVETGHEITVSYAGSSTLARQIDFGAPADVFFSASSEWMDHLQVSDRIDPASRFDLLGNRLALIGPAGGAAWLEITPALDLAALLKGGRLAMALTDAVPAGIYGKAALETLGLWEGVADAVAQTDNVRAALALVAIGAAPLGVVYASDALADERVRIVGIFPADSHPTITYPVAAMRAARQPQTAAFLDYLRSTKAHDVFREHGFLVRAE